MEFRFSLCLLKGSASDLQVDNSLGLRELVHLLRYAAMWDIYSRKTTNCLPLVLFFLKEELLLPELAEATG